MKKILAFIILALFIPLIINAETCDNDKITLELIENETYVEGNATEKSAPVINGKNINVDLVMHKLGDGIEYVFDIINNSTEDYEINKDSFKIESDYINYELFLEDNSTIVKAGQKQRASLTVYYDNPVPSDVLLAGPVTDNKTITVNLSAGQDIENPKTGVQSLLIAFVLTLGVSSIALFILNKKGYATLVIVIGVALIIPVTVHAVCKVELKLTSNVEISGTMELCAEHRVFENGSEKYVYKYHKYEPGMSWAEYVDSQYFIDEEWVNGIGSGAFYEMPNGFMETAHLNEAVDYFRDRLELTYSNKLNREIPISVIRPKEEGCYIVIMS